MTLKSAKIKLGFVEWSKWKLKRRIGPKRRLTNCYETLGALPWGELHRDDRDEVKRMKTECRTPDGTHLLFKGCPKAEFRRILHYIDSLTFNSQPDYEFIKLLLQLPIKNYALNMDEPYDWED
ncbi:unnamed protein product [Enterobius vermicularis]|uniref:DDE_Tnp_IS66_C domain-containing protein n=1 Tax=Enterobius vermicularis TaxID=51028 RepID=A0A0N4V1A2_ENTVE|nr:unnamed protein product [Enterobius vermicularis]